MRLFLSLLLLVAGCFYSAPQPRVIEESQSTVIVLVVGTVTTDAWSCTGMAIGSDEGGTQIITNKHCGALGGAATYTLTDSKGERHTASFVRVSESADLCLLKTDAAIPPVTLARHDARKGDHVIVVGAPRGVYPVWTEGRVSGYFWATDEETDFHFSAQMISATVSPGSSGSPVFNDRNEMVGVIFAAFPDPQLTLMVPAGEIHKFLDTSQNVYFRR